jgi:hypothetical protein
MIGLLTQTLPRPGPYPELLMSLRELSAVALMEARTSGCAAQSHSTHIGVTRPLQILRFKKLNKFIKMTCWLLAKHDDDDVALAFFSFPPSVLGWLRADKNPMSK